MKDLLGREDQILVEGESRTNPDRFQGRTRTNRLVLIAANERWRGELLPVRLTEFSITEEAFDHLDGPVIRVTGPDIPAMPFSPNLEKYFLVNPEKVVAAIEQLAAY